LPLLPITLGVRNAPGAKGAAPAKGRPPVKPDLQAVLERDNHTCRCCGFRSEKYQRVMLSDPLMKTKDAFITVCPFCEACMTLGHAGTMGGGLLIWAPELTQAELNNIVRAAYVARGTGGKMADLADRALDAFRMRRTEAKKRIGGDDPLMLATVFQESMTPADYATRAVKLEGVRFFPFDRYYIAARNGEEHDVFPQILDYWRSDDGPYANLPIARWESLFESVAPKIESKVPHTASKAAK
jgi:intracellular multiplication protein IcmJ